MDDAIFNLASHWPRRIIVTVNNLLIEGRTKPGFLMKTKLHFLSIALALVVGVHRADSQGTRFFRISGPTATTITAFQPNGTMVLSNAQPGATYIVETTSSLPGGTNWVSYVQIPITNGVTTNRLIDFNPPSGMAFIPAGQFTMGDNLDGESDATPTNSVTVSAFYMDVNLVSYSQWQTVCNWATNHGYRFGNPGVGKAANHPVQTVDWYDAAKWCNARSQQTGLMPVYFTDAGLAHVYTGGEMPPYANWGAGGYRLPTEAEWEKAARGGLNGQRFPWGNTISISQANYYSDSTMFSYDLGPEAFNWAFTNGGFSYTSPVGSFAPNGYGLYDMAGNVNEWCWDCYWSVYAGGIDPRGAISGSYRVMRGGLWNNYANFTRCANRDYDGASTPGYYVGFRCARGL
jgi:formylglycine-generating enzyme